jgi:serine/threonine protein kinase
MRHQPLAAAEAAALLATVAEAVHFAHRRGFVHRDLKPGNILLDAQRQPHVVDFGLAVHESTQSQRAGHVGGTPFFMAPEQVRGETQWLDGRADVWALGVILYELLTGRRPFQAGTRAALAEEIERRDPKPPRQIAAAVPEALERICLRCLAKRPADRYATAKDLAHALRQWQSPPRARNRPAMRYTCPRPHPKIRAIVSGDSPRARLRMILQRVCQ